MSSARKSSATDADWKDDIKTSLTVPLLGPEDEEKTILLPQPLPELRFGSSEMFDHAFYFISSALKTVVSNRPQFDAGESAVKIQSIFHREIKADEMGVYGAEFSLFSDKKDLAQGESDIEFLLMKPAVDDTKVIANVSAGTASLPDILTRVKAIQKEKTHQNTFALIPLAESHQGRQHWTFLIIDNDKAYFYDPKSWLGSSYYSLTPLRDILQSQGYHLMLSKASFAGYQSMANDTHCGYLCSWMLGRVIDRITDLQLDTTLDERLTDASLWKQKVPEILIPQINDGGLPDANTIKKELDHCIPVVVTGNEGIPDAKRANESAARGGKPITLGINGPSIVRFGDYTIPSFWQRNKKRMFVATLFAAAIAVCAVFMPFALFAVVPIALLAVAKSGSDAPTKLTPVSTVSPIAMEKPVEFNIGDTTKNLINAGLASRKEISANSKVEQSVKLEKSSTPSIIRDHQASVSDSDNDDFSLDVKRKK